MAMLFWAEPTVTFDLDVFVLLPEQPDISVSPNALGDEAITTAARQELDGVPFQVMRPKYLCALWLQAGGAKRRERVELLRQAGVVDESKLADLLRRHGIEGA